jgi:hypothetical protein
MRMTLAALLLFSWVPAGPSRGLWTTWDEPWHEEVVRNADAFVLARVLSVDQDREQAVLRLMRPLAGADVTPVFKIDGFSLLRIMSYTSGAGPKLSRAFHAGAEIYLFLKLAADGLSYEIATPTTGFAAIDGERVRACYRHSYHLALVARDFYERTQIAIFRQVHEGTIDAGLMTELVNAQLRAPPKFVEDDPSSPSSLVFFNQHAALETFYYLGSAPDIAVLEPFLTSSHEHIQISAVRALSRIDTMPAKRRMLAFLTGAGASFAKVQAIAGLRRQKARELRSDLEAVLPKLGSEETGFGGSIMDPRVGTARGSPKTAAEALVAEWAAAGPR